VNGQTTTLASLTSGDYLSNAWVRVSLTAQGGQLRAVVFRPDTQQYLNANGQWQAAPPPALTATDRDLAHGGVSGPARPAQTGDPVTFDNCTSGPAQDPSGATLAQGAFAGNGLPAGWSQWSSTGAPLFQVDPGHGLAGANGLTTTGGSGDTGRAWLTTPLP